MYHVTLKTGVMITENSAFITGMNYILNIKYIEVENSYLKLQYYFTILL